MFTNSYIKVSNTFTIIALITESTLKRINDIGSKIFGNPTIEMKVVTKSGLIFKHYLQFTTIKNVFKDFLMFSIETRYERPRTRDFFSTVKVVFFTMCLLSINLLKRLFIKFSR